MSTPPEDLWPDIEKFNWEGEDALYRKYSNSFLKEYHPNPYKKSAETCSTATATRMYEKEMTIESITRNIEALEAKIKKMERYETRGRIMIEPGEFKNPEAIEEEEKETPPEDLKYFDPKDLDV